LQRVDDSGLGLVLLVDYAHTEDALRKVLAALRAHTQSGGAAANGRLLCVFGCGGDRDAKKRAPMGAAVDELADIAVLTSDNPRSEDPQAIIEAVIAGMSARRAQLHIEADRRAAIELALGLARPGDIVLVAGKGHESTQTIGKTALPFDDRKVTAQLAAQLSGRK
jgi:UDP-N-acetylmuramoyl-L-alanyl-D-glutamate--2,6-diaminopimelate ligase